MGHESDRVEMPLARPALIIDADDYERLIGIAMGAMQQQPALAEQLLEEIERADLRPSAEMPLDVVAIGSDVTFHETDSDQTRTVRIVFPRDADLDRGRVSVLTPLGAGLLGLSIGQNIRWEMGGRVRQLTIVGVNQRH
jgi:regulator of nucleoside diphosphate kinase